MKKTLWIFTNNKYYRGWTTGVFSFTEEMYREIGHKKVQYEINRMARTKAIHDKELFGPWSHRDLKLTFVKWEPLRTPEEIIVILNRDTYKDARYYVTKFIEKFKE